MPREKERRGERGEDGASTRLGKTHRTRQVTRRVRKSRKGAPTKCQELHRALGWNRKKGLRKKLDMSKESRARGKAITLLS